MPIKYCFSLKKINYSSFSIPQSFPCLPSCVFISHLVCIAAPQEICHGWLTAHSADLQQQLIIPDLLGGDGFLSHKDEQQMIPTSLKNADERFFPSRAKHGVHAQVTKVGREVLSESGGIRVPGKSQGGKSQGAGLISCPDSVGSVPPALSVQLAPLPSHTGTGWPCRSAAPELGAELCN